MTLTGRSRKNLDLFDLDVKLALVQLKSLKVFPGHSIPQAEVLAWCRKHGFGIRKSIASLYLMDKIGLIFRDKVKRGITLFDEPVKIHKEVEVGYKITYLGDEFLVFFGKLGIPKDSILSWGGKFTKNEIDSSRATTKNGGL